MLATKDYRSLKLFFLKAKKQNVLLLLLLPGMVYYLIYRYAPIFVGVTVSIKDYNLRKGILASPMAAPWFKHFLFFFRSPYFVPLLGNTLLISFSKMVLGLPLAVALAVLLYECRNVPYRRVIQSLTYMPHFLSWVVIYGMCFTLLSQTNGLINDFLRSFTGKTIPFLTSPVIFRWLIILSDIWKNTGWSAIIFMAAIAGIDVSLYEAARIDGASRTQAIRYITLPSIMPVIIVVMILRCGSILDAGFEQIFVMYNTAVISTVDIIDTWVYRTGLENFNISLSSAVGLFKSVISLILVLSVNQFAKRWGKSLW
jgi:putative aldouronate transport system permease protein